MIINVRSGGLPGSISLALIMTRAARFLVSPISPGVELTTTVGAYLRLGGCTPFRCLPVHCMDRREMECDGNGREKKSRDLPDHDNDSCNGHSGIIIQIYHVVGQL